MMFLITEMLFHIKLHFNLKIVFLIEVSLISHFFKRAQQQYSNRFSFIIKHLNHLYCIFIHHSV
jgi:hypothetical protein